MVKRLLLAIVLALVAAPALAQINFPTPSGTVNADGSVIMCPSAADATKYVPCSTTNPGPFAGAGSPSAVGITPVVCGSAASSCVLKASPGNLFSVYAECSAACWLMVFNAVAAPVNGATTAGVASGNLVECVAITAGANGSIANNGMPPSIYTVGITAAISSTTCATLTLATTGFVNGKVQ